LSKIHLYKSHFIKSHKTLQEQVCLGSKVEEMSL
jgi:hypothetical protein